MGIITPTNQSVLELKGLHLYHSAISNCSMRPRMVLDEKSLPWVSHHLDLAKGETHTPEYFGINPNGVVPTLVHDGVVIIESDDIIEYLEEKFPQPPLVSGDAQTRRAIHDWVKLAISIHVKAVKTTIYHNKMRSKMGMSAQALDDYRKRQKNPDLLEFHEKSSGGGFSAAEIAQAAGILSGCFDRIEAALEGHPYIAGDAFTLADVAWIPLHFTLIGANFSFEPYPRISAWADRIASRPSFQTGVLKWCPKF
jgi:glutathione S-transferase